MSFRFPSLRGMAQAACALVFVGVCAVALAITGNPERHAATALLQYTPYFAYLLPALGVCVLSVWLSWWWRLMSLASLGVVLVVIMGLSVGSPDEGYERFRFMTYNAKAYLALNRPNGVGQLMEEILTHDPDVVVMQDAGELLSRRDGKTPVYKALLGNREAYLFGQYIVASRYPLKDCAPGEIPFRGIPHTFVHCVVTIKGQEIDVVTVHFLTPRQGLNAVREEGLGGFDDWQRNMLDRLTQSRELASKLSKMHRPRIVAGDLNAPERSMVVRNLMYAGLRDAFSSAAFGYGFTHGHSLKFGVSFVRIDHILVSEELGVARAYVGGSKASDHRPVIADLLLHREQ